MWLKWCKIMIDKYGWNWDMSKSRKDGNLMDMIVTNVNNNAEIMHRETDVFWCEESKDFFIAGIDAFMKEFNFKPLAWRDVPKIQKPKNIESVIL